MLAVGTGHRQFRRCWEASGDACAQGVDQCNPNQVDCGKEGTRRQTSNAYVFIWGPILQGEGDKIDTLPLLNAT